MLWKHYEILGERERERELFNSQDEELALWRKYDVTNTLVVFTHLITRQPCQSGCNLPFTDEMEFRQAEKMH